MANRLDNPQSVPLPGPTGDRHLMGLTTETNLIRNIQASAVTMARAPAFSEFLNSSHRDMVQLYVDHFVTFLEIFYGRLRAVHCVPGDV